MKIIHAEIAQLAQVADLFDAYRQFYQQASDIAAAQAFIKQRMIEQDSVIFLAVDEQGNGLGFTQLYPSFSSVAMKRTWYLNDLYVAPKARKQKVGYHLLEAAQDYAQTTGAAFVKLTTAVDNLQAKALYEQTGYQKVITFDHYTRMVD